MCNENLVYMPQPVFFGTSDNCHIGAGKNVAVGFDRVCAMKEAAYNPETYEITFSLPGIYLFSLHGVGNKSKMTPPYEYRFVLDGSYSSVVSTTYNGLVYFTGSRLINLGGAPAALLLRIFKAADAELTLTALRVMMAYMGPLPPQVYPLPQEQSS